MGKNQKKMFAARVFLIGDDHREPREVKRAGSFLESNDGSLVVSAEMHQDLIEDGICVTFIGNDLAKIQAKYEGALALRNALRMMFR